MPKLNGARSKKSGSRKRQFGETKPNYGSQIKRLWDFFLTTEGPQIKRDDPSLYYSLIGKKLPKKYRKKENVQTSPVNAFIPPQSKLSTSEREALEEKEAKEKKIKQEKDFKAQQEKMKEKQRLAYNEATFYKQQRLVHWCNAHDQGNYRNIHSDEYRSKTEKKYEYY